MGPLASEMLWPFRLSSHLKKDGKKEHSGRSRVLMELSLEEINTRDLRHKLFVHKWAYKCKFVCILSKD